MIFPEFSLGPIDISPILGYIIQYMERDKTWMLVFPIFFLLFCSKKTQTGTPYFPLAVGSRWVYDYLVLDWEEGEVDTIERGQVEILINQKDSFAEREIYEVVGKITTESDTFFDTLFWEANEEGIFQYESLGAFPDTFLPLPLKKGKTWQIASFYLLLLRDDPYYYYATNIGEDTVRVRGEKFGSAQRIEYAQTEEEISGVFWLVKNIGLVKLNDKEGEVDSYTESIFEWRREE